VALAGGIASDVASADFPMFAGMFSICARPMSREHAMRQADSLLKTAAERVVGLFGVAQTQPAAASKAARVRAAHSE